MKISKKENATNKLQNKQKTSEKVSTLIKLQLHL